MKRVLLTAFEPYDHWQSNASWLALVELTKNLLAAPQVTTRLYPVDYEALRERLANDLLADYDVALHLGQAPGSACVQLEAIAINVRGRRTAPHDAFLPLVEDGPVAYQSTLPLADWAAKLRDRGIPAQVSHHAGTYLCNAALYFSHHIIGQENLRTQATFVHLPLDVSQTCGEANGMPAMPAEVSASAIQLILRAVDERGRRHDYV